MPAPQYLTAAVLKSYADARWLAEISSDTDADAVVDDNNVVLAEAMQAATADLLSYARLGGRYETAKLDALYAAGDRLMLSIVAGQTIFYLAARRGGDLPPVVDMLIKRADKSLTQLRNGERIFGGDDDAAGAGTIDLDLVPSTVRQSRRLRSDSRFFPYRGDSREY